jgi:flagellar basal body-associated protein FliL
MLTSTRCFSALLLSGSLLLAASGWSEEAKKNPAPTNGAAPATAPATAPVIAAVTTQPDPTAAIVAEGKYLYRQRDVDALMLIATRHAKMKLSKQDEEIMRQAIVNLFIAREPLQDAIAQLPAALSNSARDMLILDILDYQAELVKNTPGASNNSATQTPTPHHETAPITTAPNTNPQTAPANTGSLLIRLPPLRVARTLPALGKRTLNLTIALFFTDRALADKLQERAPVIQDAILSFVQALPPAQFAEPNQLTLKDGITAAIIAKVPEFPANAVLIPEMDAGAGEK